MKLSIGITAPLISALVHALMLVMLSRNATPADVAMILSLQVLFAFSFTILEVGIGRELSVAAARGPTNEYRVLNRIHWVGCILAGIAAIAIVMSIKLQYVAILIIVFSLAERRVAAAHACSVATGQIVLSSFILISGRLIGLVGLLAVGATTSISFDLAYCLVAAFSSMSLAVGLSTVPKVKPCEGPRRSMRKVLSVSLHYWATTLMAQARTLDVVIVSAMVPLPVAAAYALPARALQPLRIIGTSVGNLAFPLAAAGKEEAVKKLRRFASLSGIAGLASVLISLPFLPQLVPLILGPEYVLAVVPLVLFAAAAMINIPGAVMSSVLQASGRHREISMLGLGLLIVQILGLVLMLKLYGVNGAAFAVLGTYCIQLLVVSFLYQRRAK
ncbi:hypothetical protein [Dietzia sp. B44]|uniref:hypothetical protein n=1 Tax=Dietzia sp. B44 TaxID=1630633 RepID=UPI0015F8CD2D|nr:hypothetical protein [Dietzia sp. B44]MBB1055659.1 hypothetical protein [Dietzia sp. B44]